MLLFVLPVLQADQRALNSAHLLIKMLDHARELRKQLASSCINHVDIGTSFVLRLDITTFLKNSYILPASSGEHQGRPEACVQVSLALCTTSSTFPTLATIIMIKIHTLHNQKLWWDVE